MKHPSHHILRTTLLGLAAVIVLCVAAPFIIWAIFYFGIYFGYGGYKVWGHQAFAANGVAQIIPAHEMEQLYADCRQYVTYQGDDPIFNSVAYFGDRYVLTMQVPVAIQSSTSGRMVGPPRFFLHEIDTVSVSPSGRVSASYLRSLEFGMTEWSKVYGANGDFSTIGFNVNPSPVMNYAKFVSAERPSN